VRVQFEFLTPAVQHAEEADFRAEMLGIACDFQKGFRAGAKQEVVENSCAKPHASSVVIEHSLAIVNCPCVVPANLYRLRLAGIWPRAGRESRFRYDMSCPSPYHQKKSPFEKEDAF
jgi:hypothetical protein